MCCPSACYERVKEEGVGKQMPGEAAWGWWGKNKLCPQPLRCACDSTFQCSGQKGVLCLLISELPPPVHAHSVYCLLPREFQEITRRDLRLQHCKPLKRSSVPGFVKVSKDKTNPLRLQKKKPKNLPYPVPNTHPSPLWLLR